MRRALGLDLPGIAQHERHDRERRDDQAGGNPEGEVVAAGERRSGGVALGDQMPTARCGEGRENRQSERSPDLSGRVDQPGGEARILRAGAGHRDVHQGGKAHAGADAEQQHRGHHVGHVATVDGRLAEQHEGEHDRHETGREHVARAEARDQPLGVADRQRAHGERDRKEGEPDLERVVAEHPAQVQRAEEEHAEHAGDRQHLDDVRGGDVARAEDPQRHQWLARRRLPCEEAEQQRKRDAAERQRAPRPPAVLGGGLDDRVDAQHQCRGD